MAASIKKLMSPFMHHKLTKCPAVRSGLHTAHKWLTTISTADRFQYASVGSDDGTPTDTELRIQLLRNSLRSNWSRHILVLRIYKAKIIPANCHLNHQLQNGDSVSLMLNVE